VEAALALRSSRSGFVPQTRLRGNCDVANVPARGNHHPIRQTHRAIGLGQGQANPDFKASDLVGSVAGMAPRPGCQLAELHSQHAGLARPCSENRSTEREHFMPTDTI
jgi:hypothetical protein